MHDSQRSISLCGSISAGAETIIIMNLGMQALHRFSNRQGSQTASELMDWHKFELES